MNFNSVVSYMDFGNTLKKLRIEHSFTQSELAQKIKLSKANVSKYESNSVEPNLETLSLIASIFNVSTDYLLGRSTNTAENINNSVVLQGNTGNNTISNGATAADANPNSELEDEVLRVFRQLDMRAKNKALTFLYDLEESERP